MTICPKCQYQRGPHDSLVHRGICPQCGIAYGKYRAPDIDADNSENSENSENRIEYQEDVVNFRRRLWAALTYTPEQTDAITFWGRVVLYALFVLWGSSFILGGISWEGIGSSFLHSVNLPFHEFGHVLFSFFGHFMGILGGSLFQILLPLVFVIAFSFQKQDNFAAAICLWWCGQNFIDVSPYIADAPYRSLPLILGMSEDYHDWGNLLIMTNSLDKAHSLATTSFTIGCLLILLSFAWGGWILRQQYGKLP